MMKAVVRVDEEGTEAAAATEVIAVPASAPLERPFRCDRPFRFFILHKPTGAVLFSGRVDDPTKE